MNLLFHPGLSRVSSGRSAISVSIQLLPSDFSLAQSEDEQSNSYKCIRGECSCSCQEQQLSQRAKYQVLLRNKKKAEGK